MSALARPDLGEAFLTTLGFGPDFCRESHPQDEMLLYVERLVSRPDRRSLTYFLQGHQAWASIDHAVTTANSPQRCRVARSSATTNAR